HQVLAAFAWRNLNLTKIESRPMKTGLGNYFFIIDVERPNRDVLLKGVMEEIQALGIGISVLGEYPCFVVKG
ncbi:MAG: prephenate dehydratase, partial [Anaerobacillus sp.]